LDKVQNQALRAMMGAMTSTIIVEMEKTGRTQALSERSDTKIQAKQFLCKPNHQTKDRLRNLAIGGFKRISFIHKAKCLLRHNPKLPEIVSPLKSIPEQTPWRDKSEKAAYIQTQVKGLFEKDEQNDVQCKTITISFLDEEYPQDLWIRIYTDRSAQNAIKMVEQVSI
jgi:hypothetical protein